MMRHAPSTWGISRWSALVVLSMVSGLLHASDSAHDPFLPGDPIRGRAVYEDPDRGHCALCHQLPALGIAFEGNIGPSLANVGARLSSAQLRDRIINPQAQNPQSIMPAYYRTTGLVQVQEQYRGKPVLNRQEIEDLVALLAQQRDPADRPPESP